MALPVEPPTVGADRFPVMAWREGVEAPALDRARAVVTKPDEDGEGWLFIWTTPDPQNPTVNLVYRRPDSYIGSTNEDWKIATDEGVWVLRGQRGCCSPLQHFPWPWATYQMSTLGPNT